MERLPAVFRLLAPVILLFHLFNPFHSSYDKMIRKVEGSLVRIEGQKVLIEDGQTMEVHYVCTGFVVAPDLVMTAAHCLGDEMTADGAIAQMMRANLSTDILLLQTSTDRPALTFRTEPLQRFDLVTGLGYGNAWSRASILRLPVIFVDYSPIPGFPPVDIVQGGWIHGMSGGPVVDSDGHVAFMVNGSFSGGEGALSAGFGIGAEAMQEILVGL